MVKMLLTNIPTVNITELNEVIYASVKLVCYKIGVLFRKLNRNTKTEWEIRLEKQINKLQPKNTCKGRKKYTGIRWNEKTRGVSSWCNG